MGRLVAFYSRADENYFGGSLRQIPVGNTERLAGMIAEAAGAALFKIEQAEPYSADYNTCIAQAKADKQAGVRPALVTMPESLDAYDEIYLGYPNYWGDMPMAVYTFLEHYDWTGKTIHPFCTHEGSGLSGTDRNVANTCKGATVTRGLAVQGSAVDRAQSSVKDWV